MSSAIIESFEYMVIYENWEDRSVFRSTFGTSKKLHFLLSSSTFDLEIEILHPWPQQSTFPEVLEKWPRTKWKANIAGVVCELWAVKAKLQTLNFAKIRIPEKWRDMRGSSQKKLKNREEKKFCLGQFPRADFRALDHQLEKENLQQPPLISF